MYEHAAINFIQFDIFYCLQRLLVLKEDQADYQPHIYANEDLDNFSDLDAISIPDDNSFMKSLTDLSPKFNQLASICKPPHLQK